MTALAGTRARIRVRVTGTVQGVGFRPFVYRIAHEEQLAGHVLNDTHGVMLEVEGDPRAVARFVRRLRTDAPPLAVIESVACESVAPTGQSGFAIEPSVDVGTPDAPITPDCATCGDCLAELFDPHDRRYRYPFINCTNCGPRFTIVRGVPYDRPLTTMSMFAMCPECRREYDDPSDRRFHAQPNACPRCGPRLRLLDGAGEPVSHGADDPVACAARLLSDGAILAIKGVGGFHLACAAAAQDAVAALRSRKHREDKPFALMVPDVDGARTLVELNAAEETLLCSFARPIVLARRRSGVRVAPAVAPVAPELGVMLPYAPLHHVLLSDFGDALVMTSGNVSDEPIAFTDADALDRLAPIADAFLLHDREIHARTDDSVARVVRGNRPALLRRSRGYVPAGMTLPIATRSPLLACGAEQKNTFCLAKGSRAWVSHHIGDLEHYATLTAFTHGIDHLERLFAVTPSVVAHDLHPAYLSTQYALERSDVSVVAVQHHHAHLAACLAEHGLTGPAAGAIFDGTGYGSDGAIWGGELLLGGLSGFERAGWLWPVRLPGGAAAIREPWRMAFAWLFEAFGEPQEIPVRLAGLVDLRRWDAMTRIAVSPAVSPVTTSMGRLFDAVGALCGLVARASYEGQAAVELEAAANRAPRVRRGYPIAFSGSIIDPRAAIREIASDLLRGLPVPTVAARFHNGVAAATTTALLSLAGSRGLDTAVLSGGVFQNRMLLELVAAALDRAGLRVLIPERLPCNDGGIAFGQAAIAAAASR